MSLFSMPKYDPHRFPLLRLSHEQTLSVLILNAYLERTGKWEGPVYHQLMKEWLTTGLVSQKDLWQWLKDRLSHEREKAGLREDSERVIHENRFDRARKQGEKWRKEGIWGCEWGPDFPAGQPD